MNLRRELYRKIVHLSLCILLLYPFLFPLPRPLSIYTWYALGLLAAAGINSIAVKRFKLVMELETFRRELHDLLSTVDENLRKHLYILEEAIEELHRFIERQLSLLERDYERREGYVGLLYGMIGAVASVMVAPCHTFYGVAALALVDATASIASILLWKMEKTIAGEAAAFAAYTLFLLASGANPLYSVAVSFLVTTTEYFSPEDNLTVPFVGTILAAIMGFPERCPLA